MDDTLRLLVTGSRAIDDRGNRLLRERLCVYLDQAVIMNRRLRVVQGECPSGVDFGARIWAREMQAEGQPVDLEGHHPTKHPTEDFGPWPQAGPNRNRYMASLGAAACLAVVDRCNRAWCRPDPHDSHGTASCIEWAKHYGIYVDRVPLWIP